MKALNIQVKINHSKDFSFFDKNNKQNKIERNSTLSIKFVRETSVVE